MDVQHCLDPRRIQTAKDTVRPQGPLPRAVWDLGCIPDLSQLRPGDLILSTPLKGATNPIAEVQKIAGYPPEHARWTHAAVYLGVRHHIIEAVPRKGVCFSTIWDRLPDHLVRIRRPVAESQSDIGWKISVNAALLVGQRYSFADVLQLLGDAARGWWNRRSVNFISRNALICSVVYADAYAAATGWVLRNETSKETSPAFLSVTNRLEDVPMHWCKIG